MKVCILHGPNAEKSVVERAFKALNAHGAEAWEGDRDGPVNAIASRLRNERFEVLIHTVENDTSLGDARWVLAEQRNGLGHVVFGGAVNGNVAGLHLALDVE